MSEDIHDEALRQYEQAAAALQANIRRMFDDPDTVRTVLPPWSPLASWPTPPPPAPPTIPGACYEASWGWVHVKPGCHCPR